MLWPAALYEYSIEREPASSWYRQQIRQALAFGLRWTLWGSIALVWPLALSLLARSIVATLVFYTVAFVLDAVLFAVWLVRALRYSKRAARGETFTLRRTAAGTTRGIPAKH